MEIEIKAKIELDSFEIPTHVGVENIHCAGISADYSIEDRCWLSLSSIDADTLLRMCKDFTKGVFENAGKKLPTQGVPL